MTPMTMIAGFVCTEGQRAAYTKQLLYTALAAAVCWLVIRYLVVRQIQAPRRRQASIILGSFAAIIVVAVFVAGPFFYSSWGCKSLFSL